MKKTSKLFFILLMPVSLSGWSEADGPDFWQVRNVADHDILNIRMAANLQAKKIGEIPADGRCIRNLGCRGGLTLTQYTTLSEKEKTAAQKANPRWCEIEYQGLRGWVAGHYLAEGNCSSNVADQ